MGIRELAKDWAGGTIASVWTSTMEGIARLVHAIVLLTLVCLLVLGSCSSDNLKRQNFNLKIELQECQLGG